MRQHLNDLGKPGAAITGVNSRISLAPWSGDAGDAGAPRRLAIIQAGINSGDSGGDTLVDSWRDP
jgi:hypothetical protein